MAVALTKSQEEIQQLPLVELAWEIMKATKEPFYFRDLMKEIQTLRKMSEDEVMEVIARLYTEINIDGRFLCIGQNVWGLKRWYPVDKVAEKGAGKRFVRSSGDAFSDDDEDLDDDEFVEDLELDDTDDIALFNSDDDDAGDNDVDDGFVVEDEDGEFVDEDADAELEEDESMEEDGDLEESDDEDDNF